MVIIPHTKPDGDAIGSSLGLYHYLVKKGHDVTVISPTDYAAFLSWMPGNDEVMIFDFGPSKAKTEVRNADVIMALDLNALPRMGEIHKEVELSEAVKVMIDHHPEPDDFAEFKHWSTDACSTAELVLDLIDELGETDMIDKDIATCLYAGILSDTQSFKYSTTPSVLHKAARLMEFGADNEEIWEKMLNQWSEDRLRLFGYAIMEKMEYFPEHHAAMISLTADDLKRFNVKTGDTEGLVNYPLSIKGVKLAALIVDRSVIIKMSFRSKGDINVNKMAREHFNGGGHPNASGGASHEPIETVIERFKTVMPEYASGKKS